MGCWKQWQDTFQGNINKIITNFPNIILNGAYITREQLQKDLQSIVHVFGMHYIFK